MNVKLMQRKMPQNTRSCLLKLFAAALLLHWLRIITIWFFKDRPARVVAMKRNLIPDASKDDRVKYLSYQPPGGGWNNQRIALENAIVIARLLNRTLVVRAVSPHGESRRIQKAFRYPAGYSMYNRMPKDALIPLSKVIDLKQLRKLLKVVEDDNDHRGFYERYRNKTWHTVCHNPGVGFWVDNLPSVYHTAAWTIIQTKAVVTKPIKLPSHKMICKNDLEQFTRNPARYLVWGLKNELSQIDAEMLFFSEGSLKMRNLYFLDTAMARRAQHWLRKYVNFATWIRTNVKRIVEKIGEPFNAVHIRRTDLKKNHNFTQSYWLRKLSQIDPFNKTKTLFIATDEVDKTWFKPFYDIGYKLFFIEDFADLLGPFLNDTKSRQDLSGLHEQLTCARARKFVDSFYSTFSLFIRRARNRFYGLEGRDTYWPKWIGEGLIVRRKK